VADASFLAKAPALLREFIRFCHGERGIAPSLTRETLGAVDHHEPAYQRAVRSPRPQGPQALLTAMGLIGEPDPLVTAQQHLLDDLAEEMGGYDVLDSLGNAPLPDEEFAWDSVPADARDQVRTVLDQCDRCADELLGPEYRIACRRLRARAAPGIPGTSLASARPELVAAAVCWVIGRGNHRFGTRPGELKVKDLTGYFGITGSTVSQRGYQVIRAAGLQVSDNYSLIRPVPPSLLVPKRRRWIITMCDRYRAAIEGDRTGTPDRPGTIPIGLYQFRDWSRPWPPRHQHGFSTRSGNHGK
jgi:hypothetical protein